MARRLLSAVRPGDTVARLGGDEFVVLLEDLASTEEAHVVARRLDELVSAPYPLGADVLEVTTSVGIAYARPGLDAAHLLRDADQAMYRAKQLGKDRFEVFDEGLAALAETRARVDDLLRRVTEPGVLVVHYQPVVDLQTGRVEGVEALARLRGDDGRLVPPGDFIPLAEESGLIVSLGEAVLREACRQTARWRATVAPGLTVSVNLSARQAARPTLSENVLGMLAACRAARRRRCAWRSPRPRCWPRARPRCAS